MSRRALAGFYEYEGRAKVLFKPSLSWMAGGPDYQEENQTRLEAFIRSKGPRGTGLEQIYEE